MEGIKFCHLATLQVTDDLVSPKYDDTEDEVTEEDDSDDTVYECPGLAAPGQEMCVSNPFFLKGRDLPHLRHHRSTFPSLPQLKALRVVDLKERLTELGLYTKGELMSGKRLYWKCTC